MHVHKWIQVCWPGRGRRWNVTKERALIVRLNRDQKQRRCWEREEWWRGCMKCHIMLPKQHDIHNGIKDIIQTQSITLELTSLLESSIINHRLRNFWRHHMVYDRASESRWLPSWCVFFPDFGHFIMCLWGKFFWETSLYSCELYGRTTVVWIKIPLQSLINVKKQPKGARSAGGRLQWRNQPVIRGSQAKPQT